MTYPPSPPIPYRRAPLGVRRTAIWFMTAALTFAFLAGPFAANQALGPTPDEPATGPLQLGDTPADQLKDPTARPAYAAGQGPMEDPFDTAAPLLVLKPGPTIEGCTISADAMGTQGPTYACGEVTINSVTMYDNPQAEAMFERGVRALFSGSMVDLHPTIVNTEDKSTLVSFLNSTAANGTSTPVFAAEFFGTVKDASTHEHSTQGVIVTVEAPSFDAAKDTMSKVLESQNVSTDVLNQFSSSDGDGQSAQSTHKV